jgi:hypothetical protein
MKSKIFRSLSGESAEAGQDGNLPLAKVGKMISCHQASDERLRELWSFFRRKQELYFKIQPMNFRR